MVWLLTPNSLAAQITGTGTLTGRIYNPATKEYVRDAEIRVEGASIITSSESGGFYSLRQIPAGQVTVSVTYADYPKATQVVALLAGQTVERDFDLTPPAAPAQSRDGVVTLGAFVVSSEVEGQVKQIMNQRNSMNLGTSISSDVFGDVTEGNGNLFVAENYGGNWVFGVRGEF